MAASQESARPAAAGGFWRSLREFLGMGSPADWIFQQLCRSAALVIPLLIGLIVVVLAQQAWPAVQHVGWDLVTSADWNPNARTVASMAVEKPEDEEGPSSPAEVPETKDSETGRFGGLAFVYGSVVTSICAMMLAVPLGVGTAAFLSEIAPDWLKRGGSFLVELLAAIPSVVYGFWGINFLAPAVQTVFTRIGGPNVNGKGIASASLILAIMTVPYVAAVCYDVCQAVPRAQREGALALGATRWQMIWKVVLPFARPGIIGGAFLALGRAIGETMAVTMMIGNTAVIDTLTKSFRVFNIFTWRSEQLSLTVPSPFGRGDSIPSVLANTLNSTDSAMHRSALIELGLLLLVVSFLMNILARVLIWRVGKVGPTLGWWRRLWPRPVIASSHPPAVRKPLKSNSWSAGVMNEIMTAVLGLCLVVTCVPLFLILSYITVRGAGALDYNFFTKPPGALGEDEHAGLKNALIGSGIIVGIATLAAIPVGLLAAIFLAEYRRGWVAALVRFFGELLTGVPSIVVGTFVYALMRWFVGFGLLDAKHTFSGLAGSFALFIMMVPIVMRAAEEALHLVPQTLRNASHALGAHHWQTVVRVSVPAALPAIITGAFLAVARIGGETAPLLVTAFGNENISYDPTSAMAFLPKYIFEYGTSANPIREQKALAAAMVLLTFVMILNVGIRFIAGKRVVLASQGE